MRVGFVSPSVEQQDAKFEFTSSHWECLNALKLSVKYQLMSILDWKHEVFSLCGKGSGVLLSFTSNDVLLVTCVCKFQVNNAGILEGGGIENTSLDQYDRMMNINVRSIYHLTMLCVPHLIATKGSIVNVSSVTGLRAVSRIIWFHTVFLVRQFFSTVT